MLGPSSQSLEARGHLATAAALFWLLGASTACSSDENTVASGTNGGTSGSSGASGTTGGASGAAAGGATSAGGMTGAGGLPSAGGIPNAGGVPSAGGVPGAGGASAGGAAGSPSTGGAPTTGASVLQHHKNATRDGVYVDAVFTKANAAKLHRDASFSAPVAGPTYAQPLYLENGPGGKDLVIAATEQNQVSAFDAASGAVVWQKTIAPPVARSNLPCGNIDPMGITGTPVIDAASHTMFLSAMTLDGSTVKHKVFALSTDDGSTKSGWPVDVGATVTSGSTNFEPAVQGERGALVLMNGRVYVPYGGHYGDCGNYHGWVVGISVANPSAPPVAWATRARAGGIWAVGGIASDGQSLYVATGNTFAAATWMDGEAVIRLGPDLTPAQSATDYFAPSNWALLDAADIDLGGSGPVLFDVPGATPSELAIALGKDGYAYLLNRKNLGGIGTAIASVQVSRDQIINAAAAYTTAQGTYVVFRGTGIGCPGGGGGLIAVKIAAASPPTMSVAWCGAGSGRGSPAVTTTDGRANAIVWWVAIGSDDLLRGYDGDTGTLVYGGGGDPLTGINRFQTPIAAKGRLFAATNNAVVAFTTN